MSDQAEVRGSTKAGVSRWHKVALWLGGAALLGAAAHFGVLGDTFASSGTAIGPDPHHASTSAAAAGSTAHPAASATTSEVAHEAPPPSPSEAEPPAPTSLPAEDAPDRSDRRVAPGKTVDTAAGASGDTGRPAERPSAGSTAITADGKVILNLATEVELRRLPGIGHARAQAILALRDKLGRFRRIEELLRVKGIGRKRLAALRPKIVLDPL